MAPTSQREQPPEIHFLHLKVSLDAAMEVWRRLRVSNQLTLRALHHVLQATMEWSSGASHTFRIGARIYGSRTAGAPAGLRDERRTRLTRVVAPGDTFHYVLDRDASHVIEVERWSAIWPHDPPVPLCLDGAGASPPGAGAFDLLRVNAMLAALWERKPRTALS